jgi:uncharacterized protein YjbJ (UPF0337 family)
MADELDGKIKHLGGKIQEGVGELLGDKKMKRDGRLTQIEGEAEQDLDRLEDAAEEVLARKNAAKIARDGV